MVSKNLQLVIPKSIHETYKLHQRNWLMDVDTFIEVLLEKQGCI